MEAISPLLVQIGRIESVDDRNRTIDSFDQCVGHFGERMIDEDRSALRKHLFAGGFEGAAANDVALYYYFNSQIGDPSFLRRANERRGRGLWFRLSDLSNITNEIDDIRNKTSVSDFMSLYIDGVAAHLTNNHQIACAKFREASSVESGPVSLCGIHAVPDYNIVWNLPDLNAPDLISDEDFSLILGTMPRKNKTVPDLVFACDYAYFDKYFLQAVHSLRGVRGPIDPLIFGRHQTHRIANRLGLGGSFNIFVAIHGSSRARSLIQVAEEVRRVLPQANLVVYSIDAQPKSVSDVRAFFAAIRFYFLRYLLRRGRQRLLCYDVDVVFKAGYQWRLDRLLNDFDVGVFFKRLPRSSVPWRTIGAGSFAIKKSFWAEYYLDLVISYLNYQLVSLHRAWFTDQFALLWARQFCLRAVPGIRIGDNQEFGPQFDGVK